MPRPFQAPWGGVCGMGVRLCVWKVFKRCRSVSAAIFVVSIWLCLITVINLGSNGQQHNPSLKEDSNFLIRSGSLASYLTLLGFSPTVKGLGSLSSVKLKAKLLLRNELKTSITDFQTVVKAPGDGQASNLMKNEIIRGRRIQEIKFSQTGGLETLSRRSEEDPRDGHTRSNKNDSVFPSGERAQIDTKAITVMEIRPDILTPTKNQRDLQPNWAQKHEAREFRFPFLGIPKHEGSQALEESKPTSTLSSRAKNLQSKSDSRDRKTRSQDSERPSGMAEHRLPTQEKSMDEHFPQSVGKIRNRQNSFYTSNSGTINNHFNKNEWDGASERKLSTDPGNSRALSIENGYHSRNDSSTNLPDDVTNTQSLREIRPKSNLQSSAAIPMNVPKHKTELSFHNTIDQNIHSSPPKINPDAKNSERFIASHHGFDKSNKEINTSGSIHTRERGKLTHAQTRQDSTLVATANNNIVTSSEATGGRNSSSVTIGPDQIYINGGVTFLNVSAATRAVNDGRVNSYTSPGARSYVTLSQADMKYDGFELYAYNVTASNALPLNRTIPDTRPEGCENIPAYTQVLLPKATVIICFHNEAFSVLLRTITSVLDRTPAHLLEKVILVDDYSTQGSIADGLEEQLGRLDKVFFSRTTKREGLVGARLLGSRLATSEVIVFLDAHCECNVGWLEPLLYSLSLNPHKVVSPYIDTIKSENFQYKQSPARLQGGFTWRLEFGWRAAAGRSGLLQDTQPILTPVISGGLFAVQREYFTYMGSYDPQFNIWGGENFELSFKTWMCGGSVEIVPCSRVGHVFRASLPYSFTGDREETVLRNLARVASVWMDGYADIFYAAVNLPDGLDIGDTSERAQLRRDLNCQSFKWYLDNVFPQMDVVAPDTVVYGQVRNKGSLMCFDVMNSASGYHLGLSPCHGGRNQTLRLTSDKQLKQGDACIVPGINKQLMMSTCSSKVMWIYQKDHLTLEHTNLCVTSVDNAFVQLLPCEDGHTSTIRITSSSKSEHSGSSARDTRNNMGIISLTSNSFQEWTFDYSFNWKRRRRRNA